MARIPDEVIERLKTEVSLVRLVEGYGVELKKQGKDLAGRCPFHAPDDTPSLLVSESKNLWHCFGACNVGGTVIDWVMKTQGVSFRHAVELLQGDAPSLAAARVGSPPPKTGTVRQLADDFVESAEDAALLRRVIDYYHQTLKQSPEALTYLKHRGLAHPEVIDTFQLGYANRSLAYRLPQKNRAEGEAIRGQLQRLGILRDTGHEHFNGSLVIPVIDDTGAVTEVYGRKIRDDLRPGTPKHLYLPGPHRGVWNAAALSASKEIILTEALIDALTFWCAGFRNVTAAYGVHGFTDDHLAAFKAHGIERVLIAFDRDDAGEAGAVELAAKLTAAGIECFRILFPKGFDANAYALKVQPAQQSLGVAIRSAQWMGKGIAPKIQTRAANAPMELAEIVAAAVPDSSLAADTPAELPLPTQASPLPPAPSTDVAAEVSEQEIVLMLGERRWRVRGLSKNSTFEQLKVNLLVSQAEAFHVDTLDVYSARARAAYLKQAALELTVSEDLLKHDLGKILLKLEALQEQLLRDALTPKAATVTISDEDREQALALLRDPRLIERIESDLTALGIIGEDINKLTAYLACVSRKQDKPLAIVIQSTSAAGKSAVMDAVLSLMPSEERVHYSAMTGQSLFYMGEIGIKHKILAISEEAGVAEAAYALKLLQSQGELTIASTGKDATTGRLVTQEYRVEGPVMLFLTTTAIEVDEELLNRCLVLTVNESREQTRAIHALQRTRRTLAGLLAREARDGLTRTHQNAQRLLRAMPVVNPYAEALGFVDGAPRNRRDHEKYLSLIEAVTLLHQYQREVRTVEHQGKLIEYLEVTAADIQLANRLARAVLGQSLDELPPQTRRLLHLIEGHVQARMQAHACKRADARFTRRDLREATQWGHTQLKVHLARLVEMEYLLAHRAGARDSFVYELIYEGDADGAPHLAGLIEPAHEYDGQRSGEDGERSASGRPADGGRSEGTPATGNADGDSVSEVSAKPSRKRTSGAVSEKRSRSRSRTNGAAEPLSLAAAAR